MGRVTSILLGKSTEVTLGVTSESLGKSTEAILAYSHFLDVQMPPWARVWEVPARGDIPACEQGRFLE